MSLLTGARDLANRSGQECTVWHVFWAALPPYAYPPYNYPDDATRRALETISRLTRDSWAQAVQVMLTKALPGQGQLSRELADAVAVAQDRADRSRRQLTDGILLATIIERENTIQGIILASREDYLSLIQGLDGQSAGNSPRVPTMPPAQAPVVSDRELANRALNDFLKTADPTSDRRYKELHTVKTRTFLTTLAESASNRSTVVCVGQDGSLISMMESILADRLNSGTPFTGNEAPLNNYTGKVYRVEVESLVNLVNRSDAPKPTTMLKVIKEKLAAMAEKPILLLDHLEKIQGESQEMQDLRVEIAERGQLLVCGIYHSPDADESKNLHDARLGRGNMKPLWFDAYTRDETQSLLKQFVKIWQSQGRFSFAKGAFDAVIALQPGAWHDQKRKVLPGLVIDLAQDAMDTASHGEAAVQDTVNCALKSFKELREVELPRATPENRKQFEQILSRNEQEVRRLLSPASRRDPKKPIEITSAHIVAELVCHNVSEFHIPEPKFDPAPVRTRA